MNRTLPSRWKLSSLLTTLCSSLTLIMFFTSCGGVRKLQENVHRSRDDQRGNFIQTKDGTVVEGEELKVKYPFLKKAYVEINQQEKVNLRDIEIMQNDAGYYRNINGSLAPRIKKGGINTYLTYESHTTYSTGANGRGRTTHTMVPVYWVQKSDSGLVVRMTPAIVEEMVSDYQPAMDHMDAYNQRKKGTTVWNYVNTAAVLGGIALMATSVKIKQDYINSKQASAGIGLFFGGIISGMVNKVRKANNYKNLELAIDEYNAPRKGRRRR